MNNSKFLTDGKGLTSTSANFLANKGKEMIKEYQKQLEELSFVSESIELISGERKLLKQGVKDLSFIKELLDKIAQINCFCAWVREAIKAKEYLLAINKSLSILDYAELAEKTVPVEPSNPELITEEDVINSFDIKERNHYLSLEAMAATYGKYIHPGGAISNAREIYLQKKSSPSVITGSGRDAIIYTYELTAQNVDSTFLKLQEDYRTFEKELNYLKYQIKEKVNEHNLKAQEEYNTQYNEYLLSYNALNNERKQFVLEENERLVNLKIAIPNELEATFKMIEEA